MLKVPEGTAISIAPSTYPKLEPTSIRGLEIGVGISNVGVTGSAVNCIAGVSFATAELRLEKILNPIPTKTIAIETDPVDWTYAELANEYGLPVQRTYESLDNYLFTGYNDYEDLKNKIAKDYRYDTDGAIVKTYVTFQYTELGANQTYNYFTKTELVEGSTLELNAKVTFAGVSGMGNFRYGIFQKRNYSGSPRHHFF